MRRSPTASWSCYVSLKRGNVGRAVAKDLILLLLGGLITIGTSIAIEFLRRPRLTITPAPPQDFSTPFAPAGLRSLRVFVRNEPLPYCLSWMLRGPALQSRGEIFFHHLDGQSVFGKGMEGRWAGTPEPIPISVFGSGGERFKIIDFARFTSGTRLDIYPGEQEELDLAARMDQDAECYGWEQRELFSSKRTRKEPNLEAPP